MPDDLSGWGYCTQCREIHDRDADGLLCNDPRPMPRAEIVREPSRLRRWFDRIFGG